MTAAKFITLLAVLPLATGMLMACSGSSNNGENSAVEQPIRTDFPFDSKFIQVLGSNMHYIDEGEGDVILLLHGNPTSIYSWRNVVPHLTPHARVVAVDLIGMGKSDKPELEYSFLDHANYLEEFIALMDLQNVTIVGHDWGSGLEFHYATRHQDNVRGLVFMEAVLDVDFWRNHTPEYRTILEFLRSDAGLLEVLANNTIIDPGIQDDVLRPMTDIELDAYRAPFLNPEDRFLTWKWVTEIPIEGQPAAMVDLVSNYNAILQTWDLPMLLLYGNPGGEYPPEVAIGFAGQLQNAKAVSVGPALHYLMEDQPHNIGREIASWFNSLP